MTELLTIGATADLLGVSVDTVRRWESQGRITSTRTLGKQRRFSREEIDRVLTPMSPTLRWELRAHTATGEPSNCRVVWLGGTWLAVADDDYSSRSLGDFATAEAAIAAVETYLTQPVSV